MTAPQGGDGSHVVAVGMFTGKQIAAQPGVRRTTIGRWRRAGRLEARIGNEMGEGFTLPSKHAHPTASLRANTQRQVPRTTPLASPTRPSVGGDQRALVPPPPAFAPSHAPFQARNPALSALSAGGP